MSVRIDDNTPRIKFDVRTKTALFMRNFLDDVERESTPITPMLQGPLRQSVLKKVNTTSPTNVHGEIKWNKEYAAAQEAGIVRGYKVKHYTTPGTSAHYAERGVDRAMSKTTLHFTRVGLL